MNSLTVMGAGAVELAVLSRVSHPFIITLIDVHTTDSRVFLVLELAGGGELFSYVENHGPLPEPLARRVFANILSATAALHRQVRPFTFSSPDAHPLTACLCLSLSPPGHYPPRHQGTDPWLLSPPLTPPRAASLLNPLPCACGPAGERIAGRRGRRDERAPDRCVGHPQHFCSCCCCCCWLC